LISSNKRIKWKYKTEIAIPDNFQTYFWDENNKKVAIEKFIYRILEYGDFAEIKLLYNKFPNQCYDIIGRYPFIKRGVKFWIKNWHEENN